MAAKTSRAREGAAKALRPGRERAAGPKALRNLSRELIGPKGKVAVDRVIEAFGFSKAQLAETAGLSVETLYRPGRVAPKTQARLEEMLEIVSRVADWAGGKDQAMAWYRAEPIPAFGGRTARIAGEGRQGNRRARLSRSRGIGRIFLRFQGTCYRAHDPRWAFSPLSGDGARTHGGRFSPKGVPALYLALAIDGVFVEMTHGFAHGTRPACHLLI